MSLALPSLSMPANGLSFASRTPPRARPRLAQLDEPDTGRSLGDIQRDLTTNADGLRTIGSKIDDLQRQIAEALRTTRGGDEPLPQPPRAPIHIYDDGESAGDRKPALSVRA